MNEEAAMPAWRAQLGETARRSLGCYTADEVIAAIGPHILAAEQRGREAALASFACGVCGHAVGWIDSPYGGWWAHAVHPSDNHDAEDCTPSNPEDQS